MRCPGTKPQPEVIPSGCQVITAPGDPASQVNTKEEMKENKGRSWRGSYARQLTQGHQTATRKAHEVHPLSWGGATQDKEDGEREVEERTMSISQTPDPGLRLQDTGELAGAWVVKKLADISSSCHH